MAQLEALLLLRDNPQVQWDIDGVAKRLYIGQADAEATLARLCSHEFLNVSDGIYRYHCPPVLAQRVDRLAQAYRDRMIPITNLIHAKPRRIRQFADAFRLKKGPPHGGSDI